MDSKEADYILTIKGSQKELKEQIEKIFSLNPATSESQEADLGHGRIDPGNAKKLTDWTFLMNDKSGLVSSRCGEKASLHS
ncbi:hypothetical protein KI659_00100 [Litoribacter alkaliphilus]|uniref:Uncharacterized protein n=1 Tax=Litoribacter ruber TaxID=702568 RepID=A0AAP2CGV8_9BACT|nr:hypothetical protein [Litoribacter alkaliphilus]MBS9522405.1 hypothetical protein [Litoribacter alkaliphilus]